MNNKSLEKQQFTPNGTFSTPDRRRSLAECLAQMRRRMAKGATEWREATQELSLSCVTAVTAVTATSPPALTAASAALTVARPEAEASTGTTDAADKSSVGDAATAARESPDEGRGRRSEQIMRHSRVSKRHPIIYGQVLGFFERAALLVSVLFIQPRCSTVHTAEEKLYTLFTQHNISFSKLAYIFLCG